MRNLGVSKSDVMEGKAKPLHGFPRAFKNLRKFVKSAAKSFRSVLCDFQFRHSAKFHSSSRDGWEQ
jgi:hypothetical protein